MTAADAAAPRIVLAKLGLDGHDRGLNVIAMALRDAGAEVIYLGMRNTASDVLTVARDEAADLIGISILSGAHMRLVGKLLDERDVLELEEVPVVVGGTIPLEDARALEQRGAAGVFPAGTALSDVVEATVALAREHRSRALQGTDSEPRREPA